MAGIFYLAEALAGFDDDNNLSDIAGFISTNLGVTIDPSIISWSGYFAAAALASAGYMVPYGYSDPTSWATYGQAASSGVNNTVVILPPDDYGYSHIGIITGFAGDGTPIVLSGDVQDFVTEGPMDLTGAVYRTPVSPSQYATSIANAASTTPQASVLPTADSVAAPSSAAASSGSSGSQPPARAGQQIGNKDTPEKNKAREKSGPMPCGMQHADVTGTPGNFKPTTVFSPVSRLPTHEPFTGHPISQASTTNSQDGSSASGSSGSGGSGGTSGTSGLGNSGGSGGTGNGAGDTSPTTPIAPAPLTNSRLAESRKALMDPLNSDPQLRRDVIKTASMENNGTALKMQAVIESMVNRAQMNGYKSLSQAIHSGFYGPVNRGGLSGSLSAKDRADGEKALSAVAAGGNIIGYRTDQGMLTDPGARKYMAAGGDHYGYAHIQGENFFYMGDKGRQFANQQRAADVKAGIGQGTSSTQGANTDAAKAAAATAAAKSAQAATDAANQLQDDKQDAADYAGQGGSQKPSIVGGGALNKTKYNPNAPTGNSTDPDAGTDQSGAVGATDNSGGGGAGSSSSSGNGNGDGTPSNGNATSSGDAGNGQGISGVHVSGGDGGTNAEQAPTMLPEVVVNTAIKK